MTGIEKVYFNPYAQNGDYSEVSYISNPFFEPYAKTSAFVSFNYSFNPYADSTSYVSNNSFQSFTNGILDEARKIETNTPQTSSSSNDSQSVSSKSKPKENIGKLFENLSYADMKRLQEIEVKIAQIERALSTSDEATKTKLTAELEELKIEYEKIEMECFEGENLNEKYGKAGQYNFYSNISTDEFKLLVSRNEKISEYQTQLDEKNSEIDDANSSMNSTQDAQEKHQYKIQIKALERQKQKIINKMNQEIDLVTAFLKKAAEDQNNVTMNDIKTSNDNAKKEAEDKESLLKAFFDEKGNLVSDFKNENLVVSYGGKELDKELTKDILDCLYTALKDASANRGNMEQIIVNWMNMAQTRSQLAQTPIAKIVYNSTSDTSISKERVFIFNQILSTLINKNINSLNGLQSTEFVNKYIKAVNDCRDEINGNQKSSEKSPTFDLNNLYSSYLTNDAKKLYDSKLSSYVNNKDYDNAFSAIDNSSLNINDKKALYQKVCAEALKSAIQAKNIDELLKLSNMLKSKVIDFAEVNIDMMAKDIYNALVKQNDDLDKTFESNIKNSNIDVKEKFRLLKLIKPDKYSINIDSIDKLSKKEKEVLNRFKIFDGDVHYGLSQEMKTILTTLINNNAINWNLISNSSLKYSDEIRKKYFLEKMRIKDITQTDLDVSIFIKESTEVAKGDYTSAIGVLCSTDDDPKKEKIESLSPTELYTIISARDQNGNYAVLPQLCQAMYSGYNDDKSITALVTKLNQLAETLGIKERIKAHSKEAKFVFTADSGRNYPAAYEDCDDDDLQAAIAELIQKIEAKKVEVYNKLNQ